MWQRRQPGVALRPAEAGHQWLDADKYGRHVDRVASLEPVATASAHGPVLRGAAIEDAFDTTSVGAIELKGFHQPIPAFAVTALKAAPA